MIYFEWKENLNAVLINEPKLFSALSDINDGFLRKQTTFYPETAVFWKHSQNAKNPIEKNEKKIENVASLFRYFSASEEKFPVNEF